MKNLILLPVLLIVGCAPVIDVPSLRHDIKTVLKEHKVVSQTNGSTTEWTLEKRAAPQK